MAMRVESSVTSLSWIPSEVVTGLTRLSFASGLSHRGPPRAQLDDLNRMHEDDAFRFANVLHAWAEFDDNRVAASGQDGGVRMGSTTVQIGPLDATFAGLPCLIWCRHLRSATAGCGSPRPPVDAPRSGCRGGAQLAVAAIEHKGGTTYWARVTLNDATLAYLPDPTVTDAPTERCESAESLAVGIDVLLHDGQFLATEIDMATGYGHATIDAAMDFADRCGVGELVLTHHAPARTDAQLAALAAAFTRTPQGRRVRFARQDQTIPVARAAIQTAPKRESPVAEIQRTP